MDHHPPHVASMIVIDEDLQVVADMTVMMTDEADLVVDTTIDEVDMMTEREEVEVDTVEEEIEIMMIDVVDTLLVDPLHQSHQEEAEIMMIEITEEVVMIVMLPLKLLLWPLPPLMKIDILLQGEMIPLLDEEMTGEVLFLNTHTHTRTTLDSPTFLRPLPIYSNSTWHLKKAVNTDSGPFYVISYRSRY